jgi:hypothetical protein
MARTRPLSRRALFAACALAAASAGPALAQCTNVSWLNPSSPPPFLTDISQAPGSGFCQFEEFSDWNFMSLVLGSSPAFAAWPSSEQAFPASGPPQCVAPVPLGTGLKHRLAKRAVPGTALGDILEATGQPLVDQNGRYVQFEIRVDPAMCQAVTSCQLYTQSCITAAGKASYTFPAGVTGTSPKNSTPGVAEVKLAWRVMETCNLPDSPKPCKKDDLSQFFWVANVSVQPYSPKNQGQVSNLTIGLVGFHLIQKTPSHPEFIWSTWEHISNAPVCQGSDNTKCQDPSRPLPGLSTASGWSFFNPKASPPPPPVNSSQCSGAHPTPPNCFNVAYYTSATPATQPISQICRFSPCGNGDQANIGQLNKAVRAKLGTNVWSRYFLIGTVWGNPKAPPPGFPPTGPSNSVGSTQLANTTLESFFQQSTFTCFTCHNAGASVNFGSLVDLDFTHSLVRATQPGGACTVNFGTCNAAGR